MRQLTVDELEDDHIGRLVCVGLPQHSEDLDSGILSDFKDEHDSCTLVLNGKIVRTYSFLSAWVDEDQPKKRKIKIGRQS